MQFLNMSTKNFWILILALCTSAAVVCGHVILEVPPGRSSLWNYGYNTPVNYDDMQLDCGGYEVQWKANGGKCGICGDAYNQAPPRDNEAGGKYGLGIITRKYISGQILDATVNMQANHKGYWEFKLCPNNNPKVEATQECLNKHALNLAYSAGTKFDVAEVGENNQVTVSLKLPENLTCSQCVLQFTYVTGNRWARCEDGTEAVGCPPEQETFRACADISIVNVDETQTSSDQKEKDASNDILIPLLHNEATNGIPNNSFQLILKFSIEKPSSLSGDTIKIEEKNTEDTIFYDYEHNDDHGDKDDIQDIELENGEVISNDDNDDNGDHYDDNDHDDKGDIHDIELENDEVISKPEIDHDGEYHYDDNDAVYINRDGNDDSDGNGRSN